MLRFTVDVTASEPESRTISGVAVPYGEAANLGGTLYEFAPGSLRPARARTPLLLSHDMTRPVGVMAELADTEAGAVARFRVSATPDGDAALVQAQDGSRGGLSIGATIDASEERPDGTVYVTAASLTEVSLVAVPAFASADVQIVTASHPNTETHNLEVPTVDPQTDPQTPEAPEATDATEAQDTPEVTAAAPAPVIVAQRDRAPEITFDKYVRAHVRAQQGDPEAQRTVRAALSVAKTTDSDGVLPAFILSDVIGGLAGNREIADNITRRAMPAYGMTIGRPVIGTGPDGATLATPDDAAPSNKVVISTTEYGVKEWAWGGAVSLSVVERGTPDYLSIVFSEAVKDYYKDVEAVLVANLVTATTGAGAPTAAKIGAALGTVYANSGRPANLVIVAPDVFGGLIDKEGIAKFAPGSLSGSMVGNIAGLKVVASPAVAAGKAYAVASDCVELWESAPIRLTANNIGALNVELGVVSFYASAVQAKGVCAITAPLT